MVQVHLGPPECHDQVFHQQTSYVDYLHWLSIALLPIASLLFFMVLTRCFSALSGVSASAVVGSSRQMMSAERAHRSA